MIFELFVGLICLGGFYKAWTDPNQTKFFNQRDLPIKNIKKYNHSCALLILVFGIVAEIIMIGSALLGDGGVLMTIGIVAEALILCVVYAKMEKKYVREGI